MKIENGEQTTLQPGDKLFFDPRTHTVIARRDCSLLFQVCDAEDNKFLLSGFGENEFLEVLIFVGELTGLCFERIEVNEPVIGFIAR